MRLGWRQGHGSADGRQRLLGVGVLAAPGAVLLAAWLVPLAALPPCLFHRLTGVPCPTCGLARGLKALATGHPWVAVGFQPLAITALLVAGAWGVQAGVARAMGWPRLVVEMGRRDWRWGWTLLGTGVLANWAYLVGRHI